MKSQTLQVASIKRRKPVGMAVAFVFAAACGSTPPEQPKPQPPPAPEPTTRPTVVPRPTATPASDAFVYDAQGRVTGWLGQRKLASGGVVEEYCKMIYPTQDPVINGFFCSSDPPTEAAANEVYEQRRRDYDASKNRTR